jgi:hydrogenase-4 component F
MWVLLWLPLAVPLAIAATVVATREPALARWAGVLVSGVALASGVGLVSAVLHDSVPTSGGGLLRADALSAFMLSAVGAVGLTATWGGLSRADEQDAQARSYAALVCLFLGAMSLAVLADNLGVMWVAVEATTIATAFLVGHNRTRRSLEAAWKYVVLGSVGVAIALLGLVLLYAAARAAGEPTLSWEVLDRTRPALDPALVKVAAALAVLGFATKAGLAPMHTWLPDAHSQAPAPVSGLMSGVLLSVAFYAILRIQAVVNPVLGAGFLRGFLAVAGLLSLTVAAALLLRQRDYKRMLAYSSIEHMGLLSLGAAVGGPLALAAVLLHVLGHGLAKASLFVVSGRLLATEGTTAISGVRGLLARRPGLGVPWLVGMAALLGFPPFSLFFSEVGIFLAGWSAGMGMVMGVALFLLLVLFASLTRLTASMALGFTTGETLAGSSVATSATTSGRADHPDDSDRSAHGPRLPVALALAATAVVAFLASPVGSLLSRAAAVLGGSA